VSKTTFLNLGPDRFLLTGFCFAHQTALEYGFRVISKLKRPCGSEGEGMKFKLSGSTSLSRVVWCIIIGVIVAGFLVHWLLPARG
jgi:hypothetical protein